MSEPDWSKRFNLEPPDTDDVLAAYRNYYDPEYGNPAAQEAWEKNNGAEFDAWLAQVKAEAWDEGYRSGGSHARREWSDEPGLPDNPNPYRESEASHE